jgi:hypothetical protein
MRRAFAHHRAIVARIERAPSSLRSARFQHNGGARRWRCAGIVDTNGRLLGIGDIDLGKHRFAAAIAP